MFSPQFWMISSAMKIHSWEVSFKPLEPTHFPGVEEIPGSRSNLRSAMGFSQLVFRYFTPQNGLGIYINQL